MAFWAWEDCSPFCIHHPGVVLVALGVIGETIWEEHKKLKRYFAWMLIAGLLLEMREAVNEDGKVEELRKENNELGLKLKNWPLEQNVSSISAILTFSVKGTNDDRIPPYATSNLVATLELCDTGVEYSNEKPFPRKSPTTAFHNLESYDVELLELPGTDNRGYMLQFQSAWDWTAMEVFNGFDIPMKAGRAMELINGLRINLKFLPHDSEVISGNVKITVNANDPSTTKIFKILPQKAKNDIGAFGVWDHSRGFTLVTTN